MNSAGDMLFVLDFLYITGPALKFAAFGLNGGELTDLLFSCVFPIRLQLRNDLTPRRFYRIY